MNDITFITHAQTGYRQGTVILQVGKENRTVKYNSGQVTVGNVTVLVDSAGMPVRTSLDYVNLAEIVLAIHVATVIKEKLGGAIS